jgi:hypothetical protein
MKDKKTYNLFLDDFRNVSDAHNYLPIPEYALEDWVVVRNYYAFISVIQGKGIPEIVSFDHDLADIHYKKQNFDYDAPDYEKTGYHCAKWLIEYCIDNELELPKRIIIHSMNPYGSRNIKSLFDTYNKIYGKESQDIPMLRR